MPCWSYLASQATGVLTECDGFAERTGWVMGDDGILVYDRNGNGTVAPVAVRATEGGKSARPGCHVGNRRANAREPGCRVGNRRANAKKHGFEVLETLDTNRDGKIVSFPARLRHDASDADFGNLRVWQDANEDGVCDAGELKTLAVLRRMQGANHMFSGERYLEVRQ